MTVHASIIDKECLVREPADEEGLLMSTNEDTYEEKGWNKKKISRIHACTGKEGLATFEFTLAEEDVGNNRWVKAETMPPLIFNS